MSYVRTILSRIAGLFRSKQLDRDLQTEVHAHVEMLAEENLRRGLSLAQARYAALRDFGGIEQMKEIYREQRGVPFIETFLQDLRYGLRMLARRPAFTALVVLTLGLGIGVSTATFSIVDAVLLRPLPYRQPDRLVAVWGAQVGHVGTSKNFDSYPEFQEWKRSNHSFEQLEAITWALAGQTMSWRGKPQRVLAIPATQGFFLLLGVRAAQGRTFQPEDLAGCAVVLSHRFWKERLGAPAGIVGGNLTLEGKACTVVGVMAPDFDFYPRQSDLWTLITPQTDNLPNPYDYIVGVIGRLKPHVSPAGAQAELTAIHQALLPQLPPKAWIYQLTPVVYDLQSEFTWLAGRNLRTGLLIMLAAVMVVLLIACLNVANLLLGRAGERERELAIRAALGSGRRRLLRELLTESLLLALLGAALGIVLAVAGVAYFRAANPVELPPGSVVAVNGQVMAFTAMMAMLTGVLFGLYPAWKASRPDLDEVLKQSGRGVTRNLLNHRGAKLLVVMETALSLVLLAAAGLLIRSIARFGSAPLGFNPDHLLTARIDPPKAVYSDPHRAAAFYTALLSNLGATPGSRAVALSTWLPLGGGGIMAFAVQGRPAPPRGIGDTVVDDVSADFLRTTEIPLFQGRMFDGRDRAQSQQVAIVNEALVREYFPNENPIGREIKVVEDSATPWLTIVGVVGDLKRTVVYQEMGYIVPPTIYRPLLQDMPDSVGIILRTAGDPMTMRPAMERAVAGLDKDMPVSDIKTADERIAEFFGQPRFRTAMLGAFAGLALLLAAIGLYGVMSQSASQRRHEIGIRMALGAERRHVFRLVVGQGLGLAAAGVAIGLVGALGLTRVLVGMLYGVKPVDPVTLLAVILILVAVGGLASYIPARRATKVDPMEALRHE
jgi:predicted permease